MTDYITPALERLEQLHEARTHVEHALDELTHAKVIVKKTWSNWSNYEHKRDGTLGVFHLTRVVGRELDQEINIVVSQIGNLIARDIIAPIARASLHPVAWLTGNAYMPPIRDIAPVEYIYQLDSRGDIFSSLVETIGNALEREQVYMSEPEYDNSIYVVDLRRWEHIDLLESDDNSLNDEWQAIEKENANAT